MIDLSEKTKMPLSAVWAVILVVAGGVVWATKMSLSDTAQGQDIEKIKTDYAQAQVSTSNALQKLDRRLYRIQIKLGIKPLEGED